MFDRLRSSSKDQGAPAMDRKKLEAWQKSRSQGVKGGDAHYQYSIKGGAPPPPRPPRDPVYPTQRQQNRQSLKPAPPVQAPNQHRNSNYPRPASSVYSQPSPAAATFAAQQLRVEVPPYNQPYNPNEVSPPSSPDAFSPQDEPNPGDVSPIDDIPGMSQLAIDPRGPAKNESRTNIPAARRERRKNSDAAMNALREAKSRERLKQQRPYGHDVRWDPNTGEPTTDTKGRPSQVNPQQYVQGLGDRPGSVSPPPAKPTHQSPISFGDRLRRIRQPSGSPQPESAPRPAWRGASGRTTLVAPVNDTEDVAPLQLPRKSSKRAAREAGALARIDSVDSGITSQPQSPSIAVTNTNANPHMYPSSPLSDDNMASNPQQSLQVPSNDKAVRRKPTGAPGHQPQQSTSSSVYSQQEIHPAQAPLPNTSLEGWTQPPSRFSITTYATSNQSTHRESIEEDTPPVPAPSEPSILDRKRPVVSGYDNNSPQKSIPAEPVKISLDSYYVMGAGSNVKGNNNNKPNIKNKAINNISLHDNSSKLSITSTMDKSLPPAPPETQSLEAQDRVAQLDARLRALGNRRINLNTAIKQMTELMPTDHILASEAVARRREEEKRKVETLRLELADVERESYDLGLKLHRAYKRLDRNAEYEPTTLWVRRVTG